MIRIANFAARWTLSFRRMRDSRLLVSLVRIASFADDWSLVKRFTYASFILMLLGMAGIGWWVGEKIKIGVIKEATATTALYMDSFIAPNLQELGQSSSITAEHIAVLNNLFDKNNLGSRTVSVKIWDKDHRIIYSNIPSLVGRTFSDTADQLASWNGAITGDISNLQEDENVEERRLSSDPLFQIYSPIRLNGTNQIIAVAEFYQKVDTLQAEIVTAQRRSWLIVGTTMMAMYLLLVGFVQWAGNRLGQQDLELKNQVTQLTQLLAHNKELTKRVRLAAANTTALNERLLRRISAELHDGPVQELGLALMRLDRVIGQNEICSLANPNNACGNQLPAIQTLVQQAIQEIRTLAAGLGLPELENLKLTEVLERVVKSHQRHSGTKIALTLGDLPDGAELSVKITAYRLIQEALKNSQRHAGAIAQEVHAHCEGNELWIEVSDKGPGFDLSKPVDWEKHLGLNGMRERVESLGGIFQIESGPNHGTRVISHLSLHPIGATIHVHE